MWFHGPGSLTFSRVVLVLLLSLYSVEATRMLYTVRWLDDRQTLQHKTTIGKPIPNDKAKLVIANMAKWSQGEDLAAFTKDKKSVEVYNKKPYPSIHAVGHSVTAMQNTVWRNIKPE